MGSAWVQQQLPGPALPRKEPGHGTTPHKEARVHETEYHMVWWSSPTTLLWYSDVMANLFRSHTIHFYCFRECTCGIIRACQQDLRIRAPVMFHGGLWLDAQGWCCGRLLVALDSFDQRVASTP